MIKMICLDLDGTILNNKGKVSEKTRVYLKELKDKWYIITITTGRMYASTLSVGTEFANYIITDTGACIYDNETGELLFKDSISKDIVEKILEDYDDKYRYIHICDKNTIYKYSDEIENNAIFKTVKDKEYILSTCGDVTHMTIGMKDNELLNELYDKLATNFSLNMTIMQNNLTGRKWIDIGPVNSSKYNSIRKLASLTNIDNECIMAFGDGNNDIEMLTKCGKGIAMKNQDKFTRLGKIR